MQTDTPVVRFRDAGSDTIDSFPATPELSRLLAGAAAILSGLGDEKVEVSFSAILGALLACEDPTSRWMQGYVSERGIRLDRLNEKLRLSGGPGELRERAGQCAAHEERLTRGAGLVRSFSVRQALDTAREIQQGLYGPGSERPFDVPLLIAALASRPQYHPEDFLALGIDRVDWARELVRHVTTNEPEQAHLWERFLDRTYPNSRTPRDRGDAPNTTEVAQNAVGAATSAGRADIDTAGTDLGRDAMEHHVLVALQLAFTRSSGLVKSSDVVWAVVSASSAAPGSDSPSFKHLAKLVPLPEKGPAPSGSLPTPQWDRLDKALRSQLEYARRPLGTRQEPTKLWGRDLVAAALLCGGESAALIETAGTTLDRVRDHWYRYLISDTSHRTSEQWRAWWRDAQVPLPGTSPTRVGLATESDEGDDKLDVKKEARALARLILDRKVEAPLSIGLLGDWGSGKSFFIEQIKDQISALKSEHHPDLYENPIEIEFNAWHASDSNLWASLVTHIFDEIWQNVSPAGTEDPDAARRRLLKEIEDARGAVHEAEAQVEQGRMALAKAEQDLARKREDLAWEKLVQTESKARRSLEKGSPTRTASVRSIES